MKTGVKTGAGFSVFILFAIYTALSIPVIAWLVQVSEPMEEWGPLLGPLAFAVLFSVLATLMVPSSFMKLVAGALFGFQGGLIAGWLGAMGGAILPFFIGRYLAAERVRRWVDGIPRVVSLDRAIEENGLMVTVFIRLSMVIPYNLVNWMLGPSRLRTRDYMVGNIATLGPTILYAWWGSRLGDILAVKEAGGVPKDGLWWVSMGASLVLTIGGIIWMDRIARSKLEEMIDAAE